MRHDVSIPLQGLTRIGRQSFGHGTILPENVCPAETSPLVRGRWGFRVQRHLLPAVAHGVQGLLFREQYVKSGLACMLLSTDFAFSACNCFTGPHSHMWCCTCCGPMLCRRFSPAESCGLCGVIIGISCWLFAPLHAFAEVCGDLSDRLKSLNSTRHSNTACKSVACWVMYSTLSLNRLVEPSLSTL